MHHFGRGLVGTSGTFGRLGDQPTHPELLDYLASRFMAEGWSLKKLHREIMLSATYQLGSRLLMNTMLRSIRITYFCGDRTVVD